MLRLVLMAAAGKQQAVDAFTVSRVARAAVIEGAIQCGVERGMMRAERPLWETPDRGMGEQLAVRMSWLWMVGGWFAGRRAERSGELWACCEWGGAGRLRLAGKGEEGERGVGRWERESWGR